MSNVAHLEDRLRKALKGQWGLFLRDRISLEGDFTPEQLRELASISEAMIAAKVELVEISRDRNWDEEEDD